MNKKIPTLWEVLESKGAEYAPFDINRRYRIYEQLAPIYGFDEYFTKQCKVIHIMGTNGKGSTGRFIAMGLAQHNKRVLHFSSPHLLSFNERYYIHTPIYEGNIHEVELEQAHQELWNIESIHEASYFEYATFLALFLAKDYEYLILEAGIGGEYDCTSVIGANVSVFTLIGLDHQDMLGNSVREIALTKLAAMRGYTIVAKQEHEEVVSLATRIAKKRGITCDIYQDKHLIDDIDGFNSYIQAHNLPSFLCDNLHTAVRTLAFFGIKFVFKTLRPLSIPGRCEIFNSHVVLDVGHNIDGARVLRKHFGKKRVNLVYNSYVQKDIKSILLTLMPIIKKVFIISVENPRICPKESLIEMLQELSIEYDDFDIGGMVKGEDYLVFGSFSVVETFIKQYKHKGIECRIN